MKKKQAKNPYTILYFLMLCTVTISASFLYAEETRQDLVDLEVRMNPSDSNPGIVIFWGESNEENIRGYTLQWKYAADGTWRRIDLPPQPDYVFKEFQTTHAYEFKVLIRYDSGFEEVYSKTVTFLPE